MLVNPISVRDGAVAIAGRPLLRHIDLTVHPGDVIALLGENGSGKSTLVKLILGLLPAAGGEVRLFDTPLAEFRQWERVGYVPQRTTATPGVPATVWEVVASGRLPRRRLFQPLGRAGRDAVRRALEAVGLEDRSNDPLSSLSGGQQQRALIARALAAEPELFVLDEPNAGVDTTNQEALADTLAVLVERGATVVVVLHELGPMEPLITRSVVVHDGLITYDGPPLPHAHGSHHHHPRSSPMAVVPAVTAPLDGGLS